MDGGAWWAAVCGVAQSQIRLKRLSSSSREGLYKIFAKSEKILENFFYWISELG